MPFPGDLGSMDRIEARVAELAKSMKRLETKLDAATPEKPVAPAPAGPIEFAGSGRRFLVRELEEENSGPIW